MKNQDWLKRINLLVVFFLLLTSILMYRLFQKQVKDYAEYIKSAENQYTIKKDLPANRGKIYASDMFPLATNNRVYQVSVVPRQVKDKVDTAQKLSEALLLDRKELFGKINNNSYYLPPIKKKMSEAEAQKIVDLKLKGVLVSPESVRYYPEGELASQILGFVNGENKGCYGLEGYFDNELKGISGEVFGQKDNRGRLFGVDSQLEPRNGLDVVLTIDHNIQYQTEVALKDSVERYQADSGSVIIAEPRTGKILAMANYPSFNPNEFNKVSTESQELFNNTAINGAWEPGSIFKPIIMAMALDKGLIEPETSEVFGASVVIDGYVINNSVNRAYGRETMTQVLENSDNIGMVWVSDLLGKDAMFKYLKDFGFGRKTGIELDTESAGEVSDVKKWSKSQTATISFGQGLTVTPIQILSAASTIANNGKLMQPYIVEKTIDFSGKEDVRQPKEISRVVKEDAAKKTAKMMVSVVENGHGKRASVSGYKVAGKTGTAQIPKPGGGYYKDRHIGSFVGFAPVDNPAFVMLVRLNNPKNVEWAESSAAPTFGEIAKWLLDYLQVQPDK